MAGIAYVNSDTNGKGLENFNDVQLIGLVLSEPGEYVIFGRVVIRNDDGDAQAASARTYTGNQSLVDRADVRIPGSSSQTIHLQGTVRVVAAAPDTHLVSILCSTFRGFASQSSLFAIQVDRLAYD